MTTPLRGENHLCQCQKPTYFEYAYLNFIIYFVPTLQSDVMIAAS
jgi:hypothetical protein